MDDIESETDDQDWDFDDIEADEQEAQSLFCDRKFHSIDEAIQYDSEYFDFNFGDYRKQAGLDEIETIMCINYLRSQHAAGADFRPVLSEATAGGPRPWRDDKYMQQVLEDDALLMHDWEDDMELNARRESNVEIEDRLDKASIAEEMERLQSENQMLRSTVHCLAEYLPEDVRSELQGARTGAYHEAIMKNPQLFAGATVLDLGCGTGILSMMSARAGASQVFGIDGSRRMAETAAKICLANSLSSVDGGPVSIIAAQIEDVPNLPTDKVDVIVSEWMGYTLFFETMLDSVLYARDRWLRPGGAMLPDAATLYIAGATQEALNLDFWRDVYGFNMSPIAASIAQDSQGKAIITDVAASSIVTDPVPVRTFDLSIMRSNDAEFSSEFRLPLKERGLQTACDAIVVWFDVGFSPRFCTQHPVSLSTSPFKESTHWGQTVLPLRQAIHLEVDGRKGGAVSGRMSIARSQLHRSLDISLEYALSAVASTSSQEWVASVYSIAMT